ncbi:MAG: hypothetical protein UY92_C0003G0004 [Candidatus Magasanikbacteria bacterium GW2011_GWA2_56_11]|uniref:Uncharacterized protein n=1 Tax=Candidatus Magasanikbacteria bacterium GW2011_GWA2_56_11 TaxID=1619044 RepID=A0A0G1YH88_9BACT|nr:MAG: hypothetical protein UY92_C0003G0004 [Candidatus Magasanikbacteria bacterium GW2011_GWA2_56_11]
MPLSEANLDINPLTESLSPAQTGTDLLSVFEEMKTHIWQRRPILGEIMRKHAGKTLYDYAKDFTDVNKTPHLDTRKQDLVTVARELVTARLGADVGDAVARQLGRLPLVSTADHHGPITHPFFVNSNIISALPYFDQSGPDLPYLVSFSFASISVNNTSFPRGLVFHSQDNGAGVLVRLPILPDRLKMSVVYGAPAFADKEIAKAKAQLALKQKSGEIAARRAQRIGEVLDRYFSLPSVLAAPDFAAQVTKINYDLWPAIFHHQPEAATPVRPSGRIPDLIYLEIETLVNELLLRFHLTNSESLLYRLFFDPGHQNLAQRFFNNLPGGFSLENGWGTYFFWAVDQRLHRVRLILKDGELRSDSGEHVIALTPEAIQEALARKQIFPSMALCYLVVSLYYGVKCLGGFSQVNDLTMLKEAWRGFLAAVGEETEAAAVLPVQTKELGGDGMVLAYMGDAEQGLSPATGIDMLIEQSAGRYGHFVELAKKITLSEAMSPLLPDIYNVLYSSPDRRAEFQALSPERILRVLGLDRKLSAR